MLTHTRSVCIVAVLAAFACSLGVPSKGQETSTARPADRTPGGAVQPADKSSQVDALFLEYSRGDTPGAAVAVIRDGTPVLKKGHGLANVEQNVPCTPQTKFRIISLTKAFTAMAVMNSPLEKWYVMCRDVPLEFSPGERWSYTNAGYIVLGYLVEKLSGQPYETFLQENIFAPLGMNDTGYDHPGTILKHRAAGYSRDGSTYKNAMYFDMSLFGPSGALYSTIEDMTLWDQALYVNKLVKPELLRQAFSPAKLNDGSLVNHDGFGWVLGNNRGLDEVRATGMMPGFAAQIVRIPSQRFSVIILSNYDGLSVLDLAHEIAEIYLGEIMSPREQ